MGPSQWPCSGASLFSPRDGQTELAGLAVVCGAAASRGSRFSQEWDVSCRRWRVSRIRFLTLTQTGLLRKSSWIFGVGVLFAGMSLAAMPPQAGFVSEWYLFQTMFQGFHLSG